MTRFLCIVSFLMLAAMTANANIYIDEGFEDSTPFTDHNWPIQDSAVTTPSQTLIDTYQGINIRASAADQTTPKVTLTNSGTVSTAAKFKGLQSLKLTSGQSFFVPGPFVNRPLNWMQSTQFAAAVDTATLALPPGTQVGHYKQNWSTDGDNATIELAYQINFVVNATGGVDIVQQNTSTGVGQMYQPGWFKVITLIAQKQWEPLPFECYDPLTSTYKGPQPIGDPFHGTGTKPMMAAGFNLFVNSETPASIYKPAGFGNWPNNSPADQANATYLMSWELVAENGGVLYIDEYFWCVGYFQEGNYPDLENQDCSARINSYIAPAPPQPPSNDAKNWSLYY
jgi:hypothetical protein